MSRKISFFRSLGTAFVFLFLHISLLAQGIPATSNLYNSEIKLNGVAIDGKHQIVQNRDGSIFFPAKDLWIASYQSLEWDNENKVISFVQPGAKLTIDLTKKTIQVGTRVRTIETSDVIVNKDQILVSDRLMALIFKMEINFDAQLQRLTITTRKPTPRDYLLAEIRRSKSNASLKKNIEEIIISAEGEYLQWSTKEADNAYKWKEVDSASVPRVPVQQEAKKEAITQPPILIATPTISQSTNKTPTATTPTPTPTPTATPIPSQSTIKATSPAISNESKTNNQAVAETKNNQQKVEPIKTSPAQINEGQNKKESAEKPTEIKVEKPIDKKVESTPQVQSNTVIAVASPVVKENEKKEEKKEDSKKPEAKKVEPIDANYVVSIKYNGVPIDDFHEVYQRKSGKVFYPADVVLQAAEATVEGDSQRLVLSAENLQAKLIIDSDKKTITINGETKPLTDEDAFVTNETVLVSDEIMSKIFQFDIKFNAGTQELFIKSRRPMPRDLRLAREKRWDKLDSPEELKVPIILQEEKYVMFGNPQTDISSSWERNPEGKQSAGFSANIVGEVATLTQQLLLTGSNTNALSSAIWRAGRTSGRGQVFGIEKLYDVAMGDISGHRTPLVGDAGSGRGIRYQYSPLGRASNFDKTTIEGNSSPGWDAELYFSGNLLDFQKVNKEGRYIFKNVPLNYGDNNIKVVLYGPQGQIQEQVFKEQIGGNMVPVGEIYSSGYILQSDKPMIDLSARNAAAKAATSANNNSTTDSSTTTDNSSTLNNTTTSTTKESFLVMGSRVDYGFSNRLTIGLFAAKSVYTPLGGVTYDQDLNPILPTNQLDTYYGLELRPSLGRYALETGITGRSAGGQAAYIRFAMPIWGTTISITHDYYGLKYLAKDNGNGTLLSKSTLGLGVPLGAPGSELGAINLGFDLALQTNDTKILKTGIGYGHRLGPLFLSHQIDIQSNISPSSEINNSGLYRLKSTYRQDFWDVRAELRADLFGQGIQSLSVSGQYRPDEMNAISGNFSYSPGGAYSVGLGFSKNLGFSNVAMNVNYSEKKWSLAAAINFSLGYTGSRGLNITSRQRSTMGMADIHIYEDVDADGVFTEGVDKPIPDAGITLNSQAIENKLTDKNGMLGLDELSVFGPAVVAVGLGQVSDGFLVPMYPRIQMWPRPGNSIVVNYPLTEAGEISGYIRMQLPPVSVVGPKVTSTTATATTTQSATAKEINKDIKTSTPLTEESKSLTNNVPPSAIKSGTAQVVAAELNNKTAAPASTSDTKAAAGTFVGGKTVVINGVRERTVSAMRLQIYRPDGKLHGEVRTLSDGYFTFDNVYPGKWTLKVAPNQNWYGTSLEVVEQVIELTPEARTKTDILILYKADGSYDAAKSMAQKPEAKVESKNDKSNN